MRCARADEFESYVADPTTLEAARALHAPPDVVVEVTEGGKENGNIACGHSPVCILLLPVVVEELAFPVRYQNVTVKKAGKSSYEAVFRHNGEFVRATARDGKVVREIQLLELRTLDRNVVVEVGRAPLDAAGKPGKFVKTRVQAQVDLLTAYTKHLSDPDTGSRAISLLEVTQALGDDAFPLLEKRLGAPEEPGEVKADYFRTLCYPGPSPFERPGSAGALMRAFAAARPPAAAALAALECVERGAEPRNAALKISLSEARPLIMATLRALGETATTREFLEQASSLRQWTDDPSRSDPAEAEGTTVAIRAELDACRPGIRRSYLALLFGGPLSEHDRRALAVSELASELHGRLDPNDERDYALLVYALTRGKPEHAGTALAKLYGRDSPPTPAERKLLSEVYTKNLDAPARASLLGRLAQSSQNERNLALAWLREHLRGPASTAAKEPPAAEANEGYLPERPSDSDVVRHAAFAALGSGVDELPLLRHATRYALCDAGSGTAARDAGCGFEPVTLPERPEEVRSLADLAGYALKLAGCGPLAAERIPRVLAAKGAPALCR